MKKVGLIFLFAVVAATLQAKVTGSFLVNGNINNYYPVVFLDNAWNNNVATKLTLGRSSVHLDPNWRGAIIAKFKFHTYQWGNGVQLMDADVRENTTTGTITNFVAGWQNATWSNGSLQMVIWLRGGATTYFYTFNYAVNPAVYDDSQHSLPFPIDNNGGTLTYKTAPDPYVNVNGINVNAGITSSGNLSATGTGNNYFAGPLSIGTGATSSYALANGAAIFTKAVVKAYPWSDYVFDGSYRLAPLGDVEHYIRDHHHLPEVPSADSVEKNGVDVGGNQAVLLKKIEELTLYVIEQGQKLDEQNKLLQEQRAASKALEERLARLEKLKENAPGQLKGIAPEK